MRALISTSLLDAIQMALDDLFDSTEILGDPGDYNHNNGYGKSEKIFGLEKSIGDLKELLLDDGVSVVGVQCMGGGGKTTLALALCNDSQIKGKNWLPLNLATVYLLF